MFVFSSQSYFIHRDNMSLKVSSAEQTKAIRIKEHRFVGCVCLCSPPHQVEENTLKNLRFLFFFKNAESKEDSVWARIIVLWFPCFPSQKYFHGIKPNQPEQPLFCTKPCSGVSRPWGQKALRVILSYSWSLTQFSCLFIRDQVAQHHT